MTPGSCCSTTNGAASSSGDASPSTDGAPGDKDAAAPAAVASGGPDPELPVAVIGAGPVGLAAAAHLSRRGQRAVLLEAGPAPGTTIREWGHVRLFSPWSLCLDPVAVDLLDESGWEAPDPDALPNGADLVERYLEPLAALPSLRSMIRYGHRVTGISREGRDRLKGIDRSETPFTVRFTGPDGTDGRLRARAVIDASGTWTRPRPVGGDGLPARGEEEAGSRIRYGIPDVAGAEREAYAGRRTAVVGAGHSAANVLLDLDRVAAAAPETEIVWVLRGGRPDRLFEEGDDELRARGALEARLRKRVQDGRIRMVTDFGVRAVETTDEDVVLQDGDGRRIEVDRVVGVTGFRPDHRILRELRLELDPVTEAPRDLGPLIDPNVHSCGTVPPHGEAELRHPEPGFYLVGVKSYGRAPTFLLPTGYEQVRSVVAALAGDREAAERVELVLPETGVCSADAALAATEEEEVCRA